MSDRDLREHRQQFSSLSSKHYFNYGGQGPMSDRAMQKLSDAQQRIQREGPFAGAVNQWLQAEGHEVRRVMARSLGAAPETITLTENVTVGCNIPLWGLPWKKGDHILIGDCEHPGIIAAVEEIARRYELSVSTCALSELLKGGDPVEIIQPRLQPNTRLVVISHILWNTGQLLPLKEIVDVCHANAPQTRVLVDAAQSVGSLPLDQSGWTLPESGVDFYAFTGHKWCCGPAGVGGLYVRPEVLEETAPTFIGWRGISVDENGEPTGWTPDGRRFEVATSDYGLWGALRYSMALQEGWGDSAERYGRICELSERLWDGVRSLLGVECLLRDAPPPSGLVSFQLIDVDGQPKVDLQVAMVKQLEKEKIYLRTLESPKCVRACVHYLTLESEVDALVERIRAFLKAQ